MARGWESKSVEEQQSQASSPSTQSSRKMTAAEAALVREKESVRLSRQRVMQQLQVTLNPRRRAVLEQALADLDAKLRNLER